MLTLLKIPRPNPIQPIQERSLRLSLAVILEAPNPALWQMHLLGLLRKAGIPVKGIFYFQGLERGELLETYDGVTGLTFHWRG